MVCLLNVVALVYSLMRFSKQTSQIVHFANEFDDNEHYHIGMTVNGVRDYA